MYGDLSSDVVHCPNCNEDVPKTLYCLNCGYPLYKIEQEQKATIQPEVEPEALEVVTSKAPEVDMSVEIEQPVETYVIEEEPEAEPEQTVEIEPETEQILEIEAEPEYVAEPEPEVDEIIEIETTIEVEPEPAPEPEYVSESQPVEVEAPQEEEELAVIEEELEVIEIVEAEPEPLFDEEIEVLPDDSEEEEVLIEEPVEEEPEIEEPSDEALEYEEPEPIEEPSVEEPEIKELPEEVLEYEKPEPIVESEIVAEPQVEEPAPEEPAQQLEVVEEAVYEVEKPEEAVTFIEEETEMMEEIKIEFAPDPLTKEVMDNLAKNITLKIRLVRLLRDGQVKEETFKKLFDSYVDQGRIWVSRRDDTVRRFKADIERMEEGLVNARKDFELLEIRRNIGDADDEEYKVKAPAYKWDIEHLEVEIKNRKGGILYVVNLRKLVPDDEIVELEKMSDAEYNELDSIENISADTVAKMKETLTESLNLLNS
ncbi:zinc ribbon domain-containing protein [Candidatus Bathyarchaeota archaeon]|nr:zinc ribbon domain-containing protein [Candidatus Bathyarchaeota archaeon]